MELYKLEVIDTFLKTHNLSKYKLCRLSGISYSSLCQIYNQKNIRLKTLYNLRVFIGKSFLIV